MHPRPTTGIRVLLAVAAALLALSTASTAAARARIPDQPKQKPTAVKRTGSATTARLHGTREIVSLGHDSYSGLEIFVVKVDGRVVGIPFG
ncbi:MAG: hypothetical protein ICV64_08210 [Thermoleophilia bacterium]|nr:hypothetical protein [Thermoleophilia bacterium]